MSNDLITTDSIAITGHRDYPDRASLYRGLDRLKARQYYFGGARGIDTDSIEYLSRTQPGSQRTVVVPNRVINQPKVAQVIIKRDATRIIELGNSGPDRFMIRNRYMVDHSERTVAFYDFRGRGGTFNTINYAKGKDKLERVFSMQDYNINEFRRMSKEEFGKWTKSMKQNKVDLSSIKMILLEMIMNVFRMTVGMFADMIGYAGVKTLEELWSR